MIHEVKLSDVPMQLYFRTPHEYIFTIAGTFCLLSVYVFYVGHTCCTLDSLILFAHKMLTYQSSRFAPSDQLLHCIIKGICSCQEVDEKIDLISLLLPSKTTLIDFRQA